MPHRPPAHSYRIKVEVGLIVALSLLIVAFRAPTERAAPTTYDADVQETIPLEVIPITDPADRVPPTP